MASRGPRFSKKGSVLLDMRSPCLWFSFLLAMPQAWTSELLEDQQCSGVVDQDSARHGCLTQRLWDVRRAELGLKTQKLEEEKETAGLHPNRSPQESPQAAA